MTTDQSSVGCRPGYNPNFVRVHWLVKRHNHKTTKTKTATRRTAICYEVGGRYESMNTYFSSMDL